MHQQVLKLKTSPTQCIRCVWLSQSSTDWPIWKCPSCMRYKLSVIRNVRYVMYSFESSERVVRCLRRLNAGLSQRRFGFDSGTVYVGFTGDRFFSVYFSAPLSVSFSQCFVLIQYCAYRGKSAKEGEVETKLCRSGYQEGARVLEEKVLRHCSRAPRRLEQKYTDFEQTRL